LGGVAVARTKLQVGALGKIERICVNNPTAMAALAIGGLCMTNLKSRPVAKIVLNAGGIPAVVHLLKEPTCPVALQYTASSIETLLGWRPGLFHQHGLSPDPIDTLIQAGKRGVGSHGYFHQGPQGRVHRKHVWYMHDLYITQSAWSMHTLFPWMKILQIDDNTHSQNAPHNLFSSLL
jgi:hypothetical protein